MDTARWLRSGTEGVQKQSPGRGGGPVVCLVLSCLVLLVNGPLWAGFPVVGGEARPLAVGELASLNVAYSHLEFLFQLVQDPDGFQTLKETLDLLMTGVDPQRPCRIEAFATAEGFQNLNLWPVATDADFRGFLRNLWDADMRSAPAPEAKLASQVPMSVRNQLKTLHLQPNERLMFDLWDGYARFEGGYARLSRNLDTARLPLHPGNKAGAAAITLRVDGGAAAVALRHQAFGRHAEDRLTKLTRHKAETKTQFDLRKSWTSLQSSLLEPLLTETTKADIAIDLSPAGKRADLTGTIQPAPGTSLAEGIARRNQIQSRFAGVSSAQAVAAGSLAVSFDTGAIAAWKEFVRAAHAKVRSEMDSTPGISETARVADRQFSEWMADVAGAAVAEPVCQSVLRVWETRPGRFVMVGAVQLSEAKPFESRLRQLPSRQDVTVPGLPENVNVSEVRVVFWPRRYEEFFDASGSVFLCLSNDAIWFAVGEGATGRLASAIRESESPMETDRLCLLTADLRPLAAVWKKIHSRKPVVSSPQKEDAGEAKLSGIPLGGGLSSFLGGLDIPALAETAYQNGQGEVSISLQHTGDHLMVTAEVNEGTLRLAGLVLSQFVKENLGD